MRHLLIQLAAATALTAASLLAAQAHGTQAAAGHEAGTPAVVTAGDLEISAAWARAMLAGQKAGGAYMTLANKGAAADRLLGGASPAAGKVEVHTMEVVNDVMTMRPVEGGLEVPAGGSVELKPGSFHIMFMEVATPFAEGSAVPVTLHFEKAGNVELSLPVRAAQGGGHGHGDKAAHGDDKGHGQGHGKSHD